MQLINKKVLCLESHKFNIDGVNFQARRLVGDRETVLLAKDWETKLFPYPIGSLGEDFQQEILKMEYFEGSVLQGIRQGLLEGLDSQGRYFWVGKEALIALQENTNWLLLDGVYGSEELSLLLGESWGNECQKLGIQEMFN